MQKTKFLNSALRGAWEFSGFITNLKYHFQSSLRTCLVWAVLISIGSAASAQTTYTWNGVTSSWSAAGNWNPSGNINQSFLEWSGSNGLQLGVNDANLKGENYVRRMVFLPNVTKSYTIEGDTIQINDPRIAIDANAIVQNSSAMAQSFTAPLLFSGNNRIGIIITDGIGPIGVHNVVLGNSLSSFRVAGSNDLGIIDFNGALSGNRPFSIALNANNQIMSQTRVFLRGNNSFFSGTLRVNAGITRVLSNTALGVSSVPAEIALNATLELDNNINLSGRPIIIFGGGGAINGKGSLCNVNATNNRISSHVLLASNSFISSENGTLTIDSIGKFAGVNWNIDFRGNGNVVVNSIGLIGVQGINAIRKNMGTGTLSINGEVRHVGPLVIANGGTVELGGNQLLSSDKSGNRLDLNSGILRTNGFSQDFKELNLPNNNSLSQIYLANNPAQALHFSASNNQIWGNNAKLRIYNWQGVAGSSGTGPRIFFANDGMLSGLTDVQLNAISFEGYCDGTMLLPTGELVPTTVPLLDEVRGISPQSPNAYPGGVSGLLNSGYVGYTVSVRGCRLTSATQVSIGGVLVNDFSIVNDNELTFILGDNQQGVIAVTTISGVQISPEPFRNLGYLSVLNISGNNWMETPGLWLGTMNPPPANRTVTVWRRTIVLSSPANQTDTVKLGSTNTSSVLKLTAENVLPGAQVVMESGGLVTHNGSVSANYQPGFNQSLGALLINGQAGGLQLSLGNGRHDVSFTRIEGLGPSSRRLSIFNWKGAPESSGTDGRIFVGSDATSLNDEILRQIHFIGYCPGAKLLPNGELVPVNGQLISSVVATPYPGQPYAGYIGSTVRIEGCDLKSVTAIKIGDYTLSSFTYDPVNNPNEIFFTVEPGIPSPGNGDTLRLLTADPAVTAVGGSFKSLGYISKQNGLWGETDSWLGNALPMSNRNITIAHEIGLNVNVVGAAAPDSIFVETTGVLRWQDGRSLTINGTLVNNGTIETANDGVLNIICSSSPARSGIRNTGTFDSKGMGTVRLFSLTNGSDANLENNVTNAKPIIFNHLIVDISGNIFTPIQDNLSHIIANSLTRLKGTFVNITGLVYAEGASLIYSGGTTITRSNEWNRTSQSAYGAPMYPHTVVVNNNTVLIVTNSIPPPPFAGSPRDLAIWGDLRILNGRVQLNLSRPLTVLGNFIAGSDTATTSTAALTFSNGNNAASIELGADLTLYPNGNIDFKFPDNNNFNKRPITFYGEEASISTPGRSQLSLFNIVINKNTSLTLKTSLEVLDSINFINGILNTTQDHILLIAANAKANGGTITSFNNGPMRKVTAQAPANAAGPFRFPVGKKITPTDLRFSPVWIADLKHGIGPTIYEAEYFPTATNESPFASAFGDAALQAIWNFDWWEVRKVTNTSNTLIGARVGVPYAPGKAWTPIPPCTGCNVAVVKYHNDEATWKFTKPPYMFNNGSNTFNEELSASASGLVYSDVMYSFSPFTVGTGFSEILNTRLLAFTAQLQQNNQAYLSWEVSDIEGVKSFEVQYSTTGANFKPVGEVSPSSKNIYHFRYANVLAGDNYFRVKLVLKSGEETFSRTELLQVGSWTTRINGLVGNPLMGNTAMLDIISAKPQKCEVSVVDGAGRKIWGQSLLLHDGKNNVPLHLGSLSGGFYFIQVTTYDGVQKVVSFIKQ